MPGSATGPRLAYRLKRNGVCVNPVAAHSTQAPGEPIPAVQLATLRSSREIVLSRLTRMSLADAPRQKPDAVPASPRKP
ncbi:MAG TPA: hypothetical protein VNJ02_14190 [Vicinamibacterales bacterium]|nr:hypothetical protein [Vicinamibacterales bacterium]